MENGKIRNTTIVLADDHGMVRSGLRALLEREAGLSVIGEASDGRSAVRLIHELSPDVAVMDLHMPDLNGIEATRQVLAGTPSVKVIALSSNSDETTTIEMLRAGATGYVLKDAAFEELVTAIRTVLKGEVYLSPPVASLVVSDYIKGNSAEYSSAFSDLSAREREVLQLIAEGKATKEVANVLNVSLKTAETHRRNLMIKLNVDSVAELTKYAIRQGLTSI
jgi:DNA-binding NarL/FixJ family response regulator